MQVLNLVTLTSRTGIPQLLNSLINEPTADLSTLGYGFTPLRITPAEPSMFTVESGLNSTPGERDTLYDDAFFGVESPSFDPNFDDFFRQRFRHVFQ